VGSPPQPLVCNGGYCSAFLRDERHEANDVSLPARRTARPRSAARRGCTAKQGCCNPLRPAQRLSSGGEVRDGIQRRQSQRWHSRRDRSKRVCGHGKSMQRRFGARCCGCFSGWKIRKMHLAPSEERTALQIPQDPTDGRQEPKTSRQERDWCHHCWSSQTAVASGN